MSASSPAVAVAANLALDTVALVQRGHTGSSLRRRAVPAMPTADVRTVAEHGHLEQVTTEPADAELYTGLRRIRGVGAAR